MAKKRTSCKIAGLKYPASDKIKNRTSTIARSMACTLDSRIPCSDEQERRWLEILNQKQDNLTCVYCGNKATHLDHLYPLISDIYPTGWSSEPGNLVPCCGKCNQSKGNQDWEEYMNSDNCKHADDSKDERINRIKELLESELKPKQNNWSNNPNFKKEWENAYKSCCEALCQAQTILERYK